MKIFYLHAFLFACGLLFAFAVPAQQIVAMPVMRDSVPDSRTEVTVRENDFVYIAGHSSDVCQEAPFVSKIDLATGNVIWTAAENNETGAHGAYSITIIDENVYVMTHVIETGQDTGYRDRLWKLDKNTGVFLWNVIVDPPVGFGNENKPTVYNYSDDEILLGDEWELTLVNKASGIAGIPKSIFYGSYCIGARDGEIFFNYLNHLMKIVGFDVTNPIQVYDHSFSPNGQSKLGMTFISHDTAFVISNYFGEDYYELADLKAGKVLWEGKNSHFAAVTDFKIRGNDLFISWADYATAGGTYHFAASRVDVVTGVEKWYHALKFTETFGISGEPGGEGNAFGIDLDAAGDVYLCGNVNTDYNYGDIGVAKLSGDSGIQIYQKVLSPHATGNFASNGLDALIYQDQAIYIGDVYLIPDKQGAGYVTAFYRTNPQTGDLLSEQYYYGNNQGSSATLKLLPYSLGVVCLEKQGRFATVRVLDQNAVGEWSKRITLPGHYGTMPMDIAIGKNKEIAVFAEPLDINYPGIVGASSDSSVVLILDSAGHPLKQIPMVPGTLFGNDQSFYVFAGNFSYKFDETGILLKVPTPDVVSPLYPGFLPLKTTVSGDIVISSPSDAVVIDKNTLLQKFPIISLNPESDPVNTIEVRGDTIFSAINYSYYYPEQHSLMRCFSLSTQQQIWTQSVPAASYANYYGVTNGETGYIYTMGTYASLTQASKKTFSIRKIASRTGNIAWEYKAPEQELILGKELLFDVLHKQIVAIGSSIGSDSVKNWFTLILDTKGQLVRFDQNKDLPGTALTITQLRNGYLFLGGNNSDTDCNAGITYATFDPSSTPGPAISVSRGLKSRVHVAWTFDPAMPYSQVMRTADISQRFLPVGQWLTTSSFDDKTTVPGVLYYYFVDQSADSIHGTVRQTSTGSGYAAIDRPSLLASDGTSTRGIHLQWTKPSGANGFLLYRSDFNDSTSARLINAGAIATTSLTDATNIAAAKSYYYFVKASNDLNGSITSYFSVADRGYRRLAPPTLSLKTTADNNSLEADWSGETASYFRLYRSLVADSVHATIILDWSQQAQLIDQNVLPKTHYFYYAKAALNANGDSTSYFSVVNDAVLGEVTGLKPRVETTSLYPNPTIDYIKIMNCPPFARVYVQDSKSSQSSEIILSGNTADVRAFTPGVYIVKIVSDQGVSLLKLVKQ